MSPKEITEFFKRLKDKNMSYFFLIQLNEGKESSAPAASAGVNGNGGHLAAMFLALFRREPGLLEIVKDVITLLDMVPTNEGKVHNS